MDWPRLRTRVYASLPGLLLPLILLMALGLRLYGIDWDDGHGFHPDERSFYMRADCMFRVVSEAPHYEDCVREHPKMEPGIPSPAVFLDADKSPLNPHWFPMGSVLIYMIVLVRSLIEPFRDMSSLLDMSYIGRTIVALADVGTVFMVYLLGKIVFSRRVGLLAAALVALVVIHIQISHFYRPEPLLVFFLMASFWYMLQVMERLRLRDSALLGLFVGLTFATKVSVLPLVLPLVLAYGFSLSRIAGSGWRIPSPEQVRKVGTHALLAAVIAAAAFLITTPYALLDIFTFFGDITWQADMARTAGTVPFTVQYVNSPPFLYELQQTALWGLGLPLGIVAWGGLLFTLFKVTRRGPAWRAELLFLAWVVPNFIMLGIFEVKFLRYIFPLMPFLILMGSGMLFWTLDRARALSSPLSTVGDGWTMIRGQAIRYAPHAIVLVMAVVVAATAFYAISFERVYASPHTAVQASRWINENVPTDSVIITDNHWDEGLRDIYSYNVRQIRIYERDTLAKMDTIALDLALGDYLVFYSNRTYGSVARLPERYPLSSRYYKLLFSGELGYEPEMVFTSYPELFGVTFVDDTFSRAKIPEPESLKKFKPGSLSLNLGYADENVIDYDHPKVLLFKNVDELSYSQLLGLLTGVVTAETPRGGRMLSPSPDSHVAEDPQLGLMLSAEDKAVQRKGGTWSEIIKRDSWTNSVPILVWLLLVEVIYLAALPLATFLFRPLPDRGIVFAKILGILGVSYVAWLLASLEWMSFSRLSVLVGILTVAFLSALVLAAKWREFIEFLKRNWRLIAVAEVLFLVAFLAFVAIRMANPDLWHPFRGGEKPMDFAYLNAVLRSSYMPPFDPWFSGGYLNYYYYWGQFVVAALIKATGILPSVAYNLAVPLLFALTVTGAYSIVYNVTAGLRRLGTSNVQTPSPSMGEGWDGGDATSIPSSGGGRDGDTATPVQVENGAEGFGWWQWWIRRVAWGPVFAGLLAGLFVAVVGNLDGIAQVVKGSWNGLFHGTPFPSLDFISDFWRSSRMLPQTEDVTPSTLTFWLPDKLHSVPEIGHHITEFPFFSFLFADLHAHMIVIPFTLLATGLGLSLLVGLRDGGRWWIAITTMALAVAVGSLWAINSWDYPTYVLLAIVLIAIGVYLRTATPAVKLGLFASLSAGMVLLSILVFLPFHVNYHPYPTGIDTSKWETPLLNFMGIHGLFFFLIATFLTVISWTRVKELTRDLIRLSSNAFAPSGLWEAHLGTLTVSRGIPWVALPVALGLVVVIYLAVVGYWTAVLLCLVLAPTLWVASKVVAERGERASYALFPLVLVSLALLIGIGVEFVRVEDDIGRMNTLFKYYLEVWVLLGMASAYILWYLASRGAFSLRKPSWIRGVWLVVLIVLLGSSFMYPILGTKSRLADRFSTQNMTLDGADYMSTAVYTREGPALELGWDHAAIRWLQDNVQGSPVLLEAHSEQYDWSSRISDYTGLPTVLGWPWHQTQQRMKYSDAVRARSSAIGELYSTPVGNQQKWDTFVKERSGGNGSVVGLPEQVVVAFAAG